MESNGIAVRGTKPLPSGETASVSATSAGAMRYLFLIPRFRAGGVYVEEMLIPEDSTLTLTGVQRPISVRFLGVSARESQLDYEYADRTIKVRVPAASRTPLVDVVQVELSTFER